MMTEFKKAVTGSKKYFPRLTGHGIIPNRAASGGFVLPVILKRIRARYSL